MVQFRRVFYVIVIICLLAISTKATRCDILNEAGETMKPCQAKGTGDETKKCCLWSDALPDGDYTKTSRFAASFGGKRKFAKGKDPTPVMREKCTELGRTFDSIHDKAAKGFETVCSPVPGCANAVYNHPCNENNMGFNDGGRCFIESVDYGSSAEFEAKKCREFTYEIPVFISYPFEPVLVDKKKKFKKATRKPFVGDTEQICAQNGFKFDGSVADHHRVIICGMTTGAYAIEESKTAVKTGRTVWLDYNINKRYDNGNEYLLSLQIAGLWLVSILFVACTCFCAGAIAFYAVQMAHRWISKDIKN